MCLVPDTFSMEHATGVQPDLIRGITVAIDSVKPVARGLPSDVVEDRLVSALRDRDAYLPMSQVRLIASRLSSPRWHLWHRVKSRREALLALQCEDPGSVQLQVEVLELNRKLERFAVPRRSRLAMDGVVHEVTIDPWSEARARQIRAAASPIEVLVRPRAH